MSEVTSENLDSSSHPEGRTNLPGQAIRTRSLVIGGEFYDSLCPPKLYRNPDGTEQYRGGRKLDKDKVYAERFWERNKVQGLKDAMVENIRHAAERGQFSIFVSPDGISEDDKEKLSAYRQIARELGYEMGAYIFNKDTYGATAPLTKDIQKLNLSIR